MNQPRGCISASGYLRGAASAFLSTAIWHPDKCGRATVSDCEGIGYTSPIVHTIHVAEKYMQVVITINTIVIVIVIITIVIIAISIAIIITIIIIVVIIIVI